MHLPATMPRLLRPDRRAVAWTALLMTLGLVITLPWAGQGRARVATREAERVPAAQSIARLEAEQQLLKERIAALRAQLAEAQRRQVALRATHDELAEELKRQQMLAGLTPLVGPGVVVTLSDSTAAAPPGAAATDYIVHDTDVRDIVNALWAGGAEAVAVNGERLVATSSIVCVGTVIIVNNTRLSPPYELSAIGEAARLVETVETSPQLAMLRRRARELGLQVKLAAVPEVLLPAYRGSLALRPGEVG